PLDAKPPATRAGDEGDPAEVQARQAEAERRADEVLQGEQDQPGGVVSADAGAVPRLHRALLRAAELREASAARRSLVAALHPLDRGQDDGALGRLRAARRLRAQPDGLD